MDSIDEFVLRPVFYDQDAEAMRRIRNTVREYMTNNTQYITSHEQYLWFQQEYLPGHRAGWIEAYLFGSGDLNVGYGIVRFFQSKYWVTGAIVESYRSLGLGEHLFMLLTKKIHDRGGDSYLQVLQSNSRAISLYEKLGYKTIASDDRIYTMRSAHV